MPAPPHRTLLALFETGKVRRYSKGEVIIQGGEQPLFVYYIVRGFVKVYSINDEGEEYVHIIYKPGEIFPLIWPLKGATRKVFYEALNDNVLWAFEQESLRTRVHDDAQLANAFLLQLSEQFLVYADRVDNLEYKRARERLVYRLLFLASRFGKYRGKEVMLEPVFSQQLIASSINLARESVSREFEKLQSEGLIGYNGRHIVIKDVEALSKQLSEPTSSDFWGLRPLRAK